MEQVLKELLEKEMLRGLALGNMEVEKVELEVMVQTQQLRREKYAEEHN